MKNDKRGTGDKSKVGRKAYNSKGKRLYFTPTDNVLELVEEQEDKTAFINAAIWAYRHGGML